MIVQYTAGQVPLATLTQTLSVIVDYQSGEGEPTPPGSNVRFIDGPLMVGHPVTLLNC